MRIRELNRALVALAFLVAVAACTGSGEGDGRTSGTIRRAAPPPELAIGAVAPEFSLIGVDDDQHTFAGCAGENGTLLIYTCNHCPWAIAYEDRLIEMANTYAEKGVGTVAISCNDPRAFPGDAFDSMKVRAAEKAFPFPYLFDETQDVALAYGPKVTPHIFLFDASKTLVYRGRIDDAAKIADVTQTDLINALDQMLAGEAVTVTTTRAFGCSIKWKPEVATWPKEKKPQG